MADQLKPKHNYVTTDYKQFVMLIENRQPARTHVNKLKDAIQKNPEIMEVQPILVNEKMEIIDGQHRFIAASELGLPIHYSVVDGIGIETARDMNVMQRRWGADDYAYSYAKAGNVNYKAFNEYRREHPGLNLTSVMVVMGGETNNMSSDFRLGKFVIQREQEDIEWILSALEEIKEMTNGEIPLSKAFVSAFTQVLDNPDFEYDEFKANLRKKPELFHRTTVVRDAFRMIEDIYNFKKSVNLIRLY